LSSQLERIVEPLRAARVVRCFAINTLSEGQTQTLLAKAKPGSRYELSLRHYLRDFDLWSMRRRQS
jgi:hypothetical protein